MQATTIRKVTINAVTPTNMRAGAASSTVESDYFYATGTVRWGTSPAMTLAVGSFPLLANTITKLPGVVYMLCSATTVDVEIADFTG
jgi:hypothetical protein